MRILVTIVHYFKPTTNPSLGSQSSDPVPRLQALSTNIVALNQLFGNLQRIINIDQRIAFPVNQCQANQLDIIVCTTHNYHLLNQLNLPTNYFQHYPTQVEPMLLGFECQEILRDRLGQYDYYCFLEDDLIIRDQWFFIKLDWFTQQFGNACLLQPNRYETALSNVASKVYIDGDLSINATEPFQNIYECQELVGNIFNIPIKFIRTLNPHSGSYFLNNQQMEYWVNQPYFLNRDISFIDPLVSAATLGIMKTFRVYKTIPEQAGFLEIHHFGYRYMQLIGQEIVLSPMSI